ncbi:hypothetical protein Q028_04224 [Pseudomonas aeruginosa BWHPSA015]|nr:hypothetical protein Q028_04224 [Pseudomonas aeruginosa BWHPSA015]
MKPKQLHMAEMFSVMSWIGWGDEMMEFFLVKTSKKGAFSPFSVNPLWGRTTILPA